MQVSSAPQTILKKGTSLFFYNCYDDNVPCFHAYFLCLKIVCQQVNCRPLDIPLETNYPNDKFRSTIIEVKV